MTDYNDLVIAGAPPPTFTVTDLPIGPDGKPWRYGLVKYDGDHATVTAVGNLNLNIARQIAAHTGQHLVELVKRQPEDQ